MSRLNRIEAGVAPLPKETGLVPMGWFVDQDRAGLLIGNKGPAMWPHFSASPEYGDGKGDPLNRWTQRVVGQIAETMPGNHAITIAYPFGEMLHPFQQWAMAATGTGQSPLGLLIDPQYGLWWALRAAILFDDAAMADDVKTWQGGRKPLRHPCHHCVEKPCLYACPVGVWPRCQNDAEAPIKLDVVACRSHLDSGAEPDCTSLGCRVRAACPVGREHEYGQAQLRFHMRAFNK